jgi:hypothetical protein
VKETHSEKMQMFATGWQSFMDAPLSTQIILVPVALVAMYILYRVYKRQSKQIHANHQSVACEGDGNTIHIHVNKQKKDK